MPFFDSHPVWSPPLRRETNPLAASVRLLVQFVFLGNGIRSSNCRTPIYCPKNLPVLPTAPSLSKRSSSFDSPIVGHDKGVPQSKSRSFFFLGTPLPLRNLEVRLPIPFVGFGAGGDHPFFSGRFVCFFLPQLVRVSMSFPIAPPLPEIVLNAFPPDEFHSRLPLLWKIEDFGGFELLLSGKMTNS